MLQSILSENSLNNRELSILFWALLGIIVVSFKQDIRTSIYEFIRVLLHHKNLILLFSMASYMAVIIYVLWLIEFWDWYLLKDTLLWISFTATSLIIRSSSPKNRKARLIDYALDSLKITIFLEFIANTFTFSLVGEFIFIPVVSIVAILSAVSGMNRENQSAEKFLNWVLTIVGLVIVSLAIKNILASINTLDYLKEVRSFALPILLAFLLLPFLYLFIIITLYEEIFLVFYPHEKQGNYSLARHGKKQVLRECLLSRGKLLKLINNPISRSALIHTNSKDKIEEIISKTLKGQEVIIEVD